MAADGLSQLPVADIHIHPIGQPSWWHKGNHKPSNLYWWLCATPVVSVMHDCDGGYAVGILYGAGKETVYNQTKLTLEAQAEREHGWLQLA